MINSNHRLAALTLALGAATSTYAQPPVAPVGPGPAPGYASAQTTAATGRITAFLINPNGDVDGLLLADGTQVNFPPHLSGILVDIARVGDTIRVQGFRASAAGAVHAAVITNTSTGRTMVDQPPSPDRVPPQPAAVNAMNVEGRVVRLLHTDMGELNGAILEDGTIVRFPPPYGVQLQSQLQTNAELTATGYGTQNAYGRALEATSIAVNGQPPVTLYGPGPIAQGPAAPPPAR